MVRFMLACLMLAPFACQKKETSKANQPLGPVTETPPPSFDEILRNPTNPEGGIVEGKVPELTPEESMARKLRNEVLPIEFGVGAAGISMSTTFEEAHQILAKPIGVFSGFEFFPENIRIAWSDTEPQTPTYNGSVTTSPRWGSLNSTSS